MNTNTTPEYSAPSVAVIGELTDLTQAVVKGSIEWKPKDD